MPLRPFLLLFSVLLLTACSPRSGKGSQTGASTDSIASLLKYTSETDAERALTLIDSLKEAKAISENMANAQRAHVYFDRQQYRTAEFYGTKALKDNRLRDENRDEYYKLFRYLSSMAYDNGDNKKGLDYATRGLAEVRNDQSPHARLYEAQMLSKIGQGQMRIGRSQEGIASCEASYRLFERILHDDNQWNEAYMWYSSVGEAIQHMAICDVQAAISWLPRLDKTYANAMAVRNIPPSMSDYCKARLELTKAEVYTKSGNNTEGERHFKAYQQTELARSGDDWVSPLLYYENRREWPNVHAIYARWDSLMQTSQQPMNREYQQMLGMMFQAEMEMGQHQQALSTAQRIITNLDVVDSLTSSEDAAQLAVIYETQEKDSKISEQQASLTRQRFLATAIALGLTLVFLVFYILYRRRATRRLATAHKQLQTAYDQLEETTTQKERIESELRIARDIQMSMVPHEFPKYPGLDLYASMTPAKEVGGDLYDFLLQGDSLYFCLGDVSGKGVPASLFMAQATRLFRALAKQQIEPATIATRLNDELTEGNDSGMFVTMFIGLVNLQTGHLDFCNAGHNPPAIGTHHSSLITYHFLEVESNAPIGLWPGLEYVGEHIDSIKGRPLFVYTDGLNEAENRQQEQFGDDRLLGILRQTRFESSRQVIERLQAEVEHHRDGAEPNDDLTMLCLKISN